MQDVMDKCSELATKYVTRTGPKRAEWHWRAGSLIRFKIASIEKDRTVRMWFLALSIGII